MVIDRLLAEAKALIGRGCSSEARRLILQALNEDPRSVEAWLLLAAISAPHASVEYLNRALELDPHNAVAEEALEWARGRISLDGIGLELPRVEFQPSAGRAAGRPEGSGPMPGGQRPRALEHAAPLAATGVRPRRGTARRAPLNASLLVGGLFVLLLLAVAIVGPRIAPRDPMERRPQVIVVGDRWLYPPFAPLTVGGFPLGSDRLGRDILSRVLWGVRPTMIMVATVASARLALGLLIGMASGWSEGRLGRLLDAGISGALSVPILIVAVGVVAALGDVVGMLAFVLGLSVTGWAETARLVRDQVQGIKGQYFVEAARALGASGIEILARHVLPQIMPMVSMLMALEMSKTLMIAGGLGFLGYYIGGGIWITTEDFVERNVAGLPELGQMLSTFGALEPWGMFAAGAVVFAAILGFNLLGEGLRQRLALRGG